jgi:hypothetical protein
VALLLRGEKPLVEARTVKAAFGDIGAGLKYAFSDPVMGPMLFWVTMDSSTMQGKLWFTRPRIPS